MTENLHAHARQLMLDGAVEELATSDSAWLTRHLAECADCRKDQDGLTSTVSLLHSGTVLAPPFLAARTRAGLRSHAAVLQKAREKRSMVILALCFDIVWTTMIVGMMLGAASWMGYRGDLRWWIIGMASWLWLLPAIGMMVIVSLRKTELAPKLASWSGLSLEGGARD